LELLELGLDFVFCEDGFEGGDSRGLLFVEGRLFRLRLGLEVDRELGALRREGGDVVCVEVGHGLFGKFANLFGVRVNWKCISGVL
jgi:hypothetical protein